MAPNFLRCGPHVRPDGAATDGLRRLVWQQPHSSFATRLARTQRTQQVGFPQRRAGGHRNACIPSEDPSGDGMHLTAPRPGGGLISHQRVWALVPGLRRANSSGRRFNRPRGYVDLGPHSGGTRTRLGAAAPAYSCGISRRATFATSSLRAHLTRQLLLRTGPEGQLGRIHHPRPRQPTCLLRPPSVLRLRTRRPGSGKSRSECRGSHRS